MGAIRLLLFIQEHVQSASLFLPVSHLRVLRSVQDWQPMNAAIVIRGLLGEACELLLPIVITISKLWQFWLLIPGWVLHMRHLILSRIGILSKLVVLNSWQTNISSTLV